MQGPEYRKTSRLSNQKTDQTKKMIYADKIIQEIPYLSQGRSLATVFPHIRPAGTIFSFHFYSKVTVHI